MYYYPARVWLDSDGNPIQAHGGGILFDEKSETYYWYGENKDGETYHAHKRGAAQVDIIGVSCYSSTDLWTWKNEGVVLPGEQTNTTHDLHNSNVLERPKVLYNDRTGQYIMWMHIDDDNYTKASVGVAVSDSPVGPFHYLYSKGPHGFDSRDMTVFKDDDGQAYLIYSSDDNSELHIGPLTDDYLDVTSTVRRVLVGQHREAPAIFKQEGAYYMITSGCTGWAPNRALARGRVPDGGVGDNEESLRQREYDFSDDYIFSAEYLCSSIARAPGIIYYYGLPLESSGFEEFEICMVAFDCGRFI